MQTDAVYFQCGDNPQCKNDVGDNCPDICAQCAVLEQDYVPGAVDDVNTFIVDKMNGALDIMS